MRLDILVGPISSGKSTFCKQSAELGNIIVNDDSIVTAVHGGNYLLYEKQLKLLYKSIENNIIAMAFSLGRNVVIDRPNHSVKTRQRYIGLGHAFDAHVCLVMFERASPEVHAKRRCLSDNRGYDYAYWLDAAQRHESLYEPPNQEIEHFDEQVTWRWHGDS